MSDNASVPLALSESDRPTKAVGVVMQWVGDSLVVRTRTPPARHVLNVPAAIVWLLCDGAHPLSAITADLERIFPEDTGRVRDDVEGALRDLYAAHLIRPAMQQQEERRPLRVAFANFAPDFDTSDSYFTWALARSHDVLLVDPSSGSAQVLFYSTTQTTDFDHHEADRTKTSKVFVADGDERPDFSECDLAFSPHHVAAADAVRHHRLPFGCVRIDSLVPDNPRLSEHYAEEVICERLESVLFERNRALCAQAASPARAIRPAALTVGMATFDDYDGVYFSVQALRLFHPDVAADAEIIVVDNNPQGPCAAALRGLEDWMKRCRYVPIRETVGTAVRNVVFDQARTEYVLCMDSHVLLVPGAVRGLIDYLDANPGCGDLLQGPLMMDDLNTLSTHLDPVWRDGMYGIWATDARGLDVGHEPFEIPMQGMGLFACRKEAWLGFNRRFSGFGGEEGYIHEKFRQAGHRTLCLPFLRWVHRFNRPLGTPYRPRWEERIRNYFIGFRELGLDSSAMEAHFAERAGVEVVQRVRHQVDREQDNPFGFFETLYCINREADAGRWGVMRDRFAKLGILHRVRRFTAVETPWNHHIGCALSHRAILAEAMEQGVSSVLVFEDDALFLDRTLACLDDNLDELTRIEWDVFHLGGCKWGHTYPKADGCRHLERVGQLTCTHAVAYRHTIFERLLRELPADVASMTPWIERHAAIDQYLNHIERRYVSWPILATQPALLAQEHERYRHRFVV